MPSKHLNAIPSRHKVVIANTTGGFRVEAALPDQFGVGVGGDISSPFAGFASGGNAANALATFAGITAKVGLFVKKIYLGPDQPDFSMDLHFEAYYSAYDEVVLPVGTLMTMAAGTKDTAKNEIEKFKARNTANAQQGGIKDERLSQLTGFVSYLRSPDSVSVMFGDFLTVRNCLISAVNPAWGNVLDAAGNPMYADVSITFTLEEPLTTGEIARMFNQVKRFNRST
jgi:hypothetical protein